MILYDLWDYYNYQWDLRDRRVDDFLLMSSILPTIFLICLSYAGRPLLKRYMENRPPLNIDPLVAILNCIVVYLNFYCSLQLFIGAYRKQYNWICEPHHYNAADHEEMTMTNTKYLTYLCKQLEMFDVVLLTAKKKSVKQMGTIAFHHSFMAAYSWCVVRRHPVESVFGPILVNTFAHGVMYAYAGLTMFLPHYCKSPIVKQAYTAFLIVQFLVHIGYAWLIVNAQCSWILMPAYCAVAITSVMIIRHAIEYIHDYRRGVKTRNIKSD